MVRCIMRAFSRRVDTVRTLPYRRDSPRRFSRIKPDSVEPQTSQKGRSRIERINARLPNFLQRFSRPLINAPLAHISAFLLLHELTAVVPLLGMAAVFHYTQWLPPYISEGKWVSEYTEKFGRYFRRKGWLGEAGVARRDRYWGFGEGGLRIVVEFATAWAVVKALLPARLILSVWATPWFARIAIVPSTNLFKRLLSKRGKGTPVSSAGGTGASAAGVLSESDSKP